MVIQCIFINLLNRQDDKFKRLAGSKLKFLDFRGHKITFLLTFTIEQKAKFQLEASANKAVQTPPQS